MHRVRSSALSAFGARMPQQVMGLPRGVMHKSTAAMPAMEKKDAPKYDEMTYRELQSLCKKLGIKANSKKTVLVEALEAQTAAENSQWPPVGFSGKSVAPQINPPIDPKPRVRTAPLAPLADRTSVLRGEGAMEFLAKAKVMEQAGHDVCHLEIGDPDFDTPNHITNASLVSLQGGGTHYEPSGGSLKLRESVAEWFRKTRPGLDAKAENVICTPGGKNIIFNTIAALVESGDEVIYPNPGFPAYETTIEWFGGKPVPLKLDSKTGFSFDHDELKRVASSRTKLIIICSPGNPSGGVLSSADLDCVAEVAKACGAWVLSDEIYSQLVFEGAHDSVATRPGMEQRTIVLDGCSKNWAMTGWRVGFGLYPSQLIDPARNVCINTFSCLPPFVSAGAIAAVEGTMAPTEMMKEEFCARRDLVYDRLNAIPGISVAVKPAGAMYLMADVSGTGLEASEFASRVLFEHGVAVLDGGFFGKHGKGLVRLSFAQSRERLEEACDRIAAFCEGVRNGTPPKPLMDPSVFQRKISSLSSVTSMTSMSSITDALDVDTDLH